MGRTMQLQYLPEELAGEYTVWLRTSNDPNLSGKNYDGYERWLDKLIVKAIELKVIDENQIKITDIKWLKDFLTIYKGSKNLQDENNAHFSGGAGSASLKLFIVFLIYKKMLTSNSSVEREKLFEDYLELIKEILKTKLKKGKKDDGYPDYKSILSTWWDNDGKQHSDKASVFDYSDDDEFKSFTDQYANSVDEDTKRGIELYLKLLECSKKVQEGAMDIIDSAKENIESITVSADEHELNLILYGPPGTGKTYNTVIKAVEIIDSINPNADVSIITALNKLKSKPDDKSAYEVVFERYCELLEKGRIAFTTFHQAFGYEEFIEGIRPDLSTDDLKYKLADGVFKEFCKEARQLKKDIAQQYEINESSIVWKMSLGGADAPQIKQDCFDNNRIRLGWGGDYDPSKTDITEYTGDGKRVVNAFINEMKKGDIVFSFATAETIDAIGVILDDEAKLGEWENYKWYRNVKWIRKDIINIKAINANKRMVQPTVYKLGVSLENALALLKNSESNENDNYDYSAPYVFIIDEINRGNVSKIFGELITLIEPTKRLGAEEEMKCILPYSSDRFGVPKNVYILGTMNTADRSLVQLDAALRRRFAFEEMMPRPNLLKITGDGIDLNKLLEEINLRITSLLDREHQIGHSYFMKLDEKCNVKDVAKVFNKKIIPLLQEYFFDDYDSIKKILGEAFVDTDTKSPFDNNKSIYKIKCPEDIGSYTKIYDKNADTALDDDSGEIK